MTDVFGLAGDFTLADAPAAAWMADPAGAEGGAASTAICGCSGRGAANDNAGVLAAAAEPDDDADWPWGKGSLAGVTGGDEEGDDGEGDDVTVIGRRPRVADDDGGGGDTGAGGGVIGTGGGSGGGTGGGRGTPPPPLKDCEEVVIDNNTGAPLSPEDEADTNQLMAAINQILSAAGSKAGDTTCSHSGDTTSMREIYELVSKADFVLSPDGQTHNNDPSSTIKGVGKADRNGGNPILTINRDAFHGYMDNSACAAYYVLHEIAHTTRDVWNSRGSSSVAGEQKADALAFAIAQALGIDLRSVNSSVPSSSEQVQVTPGSGNAAGSAPVCR